MQLTPYLSFDGRCATAFKFYEQVLGGQLIMIMKHSESPMADQFPGELADKVMHARLRVGDSLLMGGDQLGEYQQPKGFCVAISVDEPEEAERVFSALAENGSVQMPMAETFWARRFGMLTDQFHIPWMVNCEKPQ